MINYNFIDSDVVKSCMKHGYNQIFIDDIDALETKFYIYNPDNYSFVEFLMQEGKLTDAKLLTSFSFNNKDTSGKKLDFMAALTDCITLKEYLGIIESPLPPAKIESPLPPYTKQLKSLGDIKVTSTYHNPRFQKHHSEHYTIKMTPTDFEMPNSTKIYTRFEGHPDPSDYSEGFERFFKSFSKFRKVMNKNPSLEKIFDEVNEKSFFYTTSLLVNSNGFNKNLLSDLNLLIKHNIIKPNFQHDLFKDFFEKQKEKVQYREERLPFYAVPDIQDSYKMTDYDKQILISIFNQRVDKFITKLNSSNEFNVRSMNYIHEIFEDNQPSSTPRSGSKFK